MTRHYQHTGIRTKEEWKEWIIKRKQKDQKRLEDEKKASGEMLRRVRNEEKEKVE